MNELSKGWVHGTLADVMQLDMGQSPPGHATNTDGIGTPLIGGAADYQENKLVASRYTTEPTKVCKPGDLILCIRATIGKLAVADRPYCLGRGVAGLRPVAVDSPFLQRYINSQVSLLDSAGTGTTFRQIDKKTLSSWSIPLPPIAEQRRIAAMLDTLFARSGAARAELNCISRLVERFKQAILAAAFRGDLTAKWRQNVKCKPVKGNESAIDPRVGDIVSLPSTWAWVGLAKTAGISGGLTKNPKRNSLELRMPYLRVANVYANELRLDEVSEIGCTEAEREKTRLSAGDLLIVEGNGSIEQIGRVAMWNGELSECLHQNHIIRVRPFSALRSKFALYWLLSPAARGAIETVASSSSGLHTLSISKVGGLPIPMAPPEEMDVVINLLELAFAAIDKTSAELARATELLNRLENATLAKAFRGELVQQDPSESPVSLLSGNIGTKAVVRKDRFAKQRSGTKKVIRTKDADAMAKKRADVRADHLTHALRVLGGTADAKHLWQRSEMDIDEFYKQLRDEIKAGRIEEDVSKERLKLANAT